ncbi:immunity 53 family protein [Saccharicrinis sp. FJH62]|uniref:immunity 53 family protein n=1 Tax=Saccharicrinis sp. FJH62 TaxID=3344657 RepID=UPI0035D504B2
MKNTLERIQDWYKTNCNNDWEHTYGISISTLDNPGWTVRIDLRETALENINFNKDYQNELNENDWYKLRIENQVLEIFCGPENLDLTLNIFLNEIIPSLANKNFKYKIYLPLKGYKYPIWTPALGYMISEDIIELSEIPKVEFSLIKVKDNKMIDFTQIDLDQLKLNFKVGDKVKTDIEVTDSNLILTTKK